MKKTSAIGFVLVVAIQTIMSQGIPAQDATKQASANTFGNAAPAADAGGDRGTPTSLIPAIPPGLSIDTAAARAALAMTTIDYPVTPGDSYILTFITAQGQTTGTLLVDSEYSINLSTLGTINGRGLSFVELKRQIEKKVLAAYSYSAPMLSIKSCGVFPIYVQGEVTRSSIIYMWGLSRLAELWSDVTPFASARNVKVTDEKGHSSFYDLHKFWRMGDLTQNPRLSPSQTILIDKYDRLVTITGEVRRPGSYQLLPGEGLADLLSAYAEGITDKGNPDALTITRLKSTLSAQGEFINLKVQADSDLKLENLDTITVSSKIDWLPSVYFEGAIGTKGIESAGVASSNRINYPFFTGEMLSNAVLALRNSFTPVSDLAKAYLVRGSTGQRLPIDLAKFVTDHDFSQDVKLEKNDYIIIPFRQYFITVGGAVMLPGRYPYVPDRTWKYYVNLAGGIDSDRNANNAIRITDSADKPRREDVMIQPEDKIFVPANSVLHFLLQFSGIISLAVSTLTLFLSLRSLLGI